MPELKKFQNRARYFRVRSLHEHSRPDDMKRMLTASTFDLRCADNKFFSFGYALVHGAPQVGFGGTSGVFKVGVTTKTLLRLMARDPASFVFHWDATYKINSLAYPVLICGLTDPGGNFHPVAFFLISEEATDEYEWAMKELMVVYAAVVGRPLQLHYAMADAALAPVAAMKTLKSQLGLKTILMCYYHCVACVTKRLGGADASVKALVARYTSKMHYSRSPAEFKTHWNQAKILWSACEALAAKDFVNYFEKQWVKGTCNKWQVYHTPEGFPTTNNPCELFNKHFKATYTLHTVHGLCATFQLLGSIAEEYSEVKSQTFALVPSPSKKLLQRFRRLVKCGLLNVVPLDASLGNEHGQLRVLGVIPTLAISMAHAFEAVSGHNAVLRDLQRQGITSMPDQQLEQANAYYYMEGANNVRHESLCGLTKQPLNGWKVSTIPGKLTCECNYFYKHKFCCHLLFALQHQRKDNLGMPLPPPTFARNASQSTGAAPRFTGKRKRSGRWAGGRDVRAGRTVGPPLSLH